MSRKNVDGGYAGESQRITVRLGWKVSCELDKLVAVWGGDRSDAIRRAVRQSAAVIRREQLDALIAEIPTMTVPAMRRAAARLYIHGRSRMNKAALQDAILARLRR